LARFIIDEGGLDPKTAFDLSGELRAVREASRKMGAEYKLVRGNGKSIDYMSQLARNVV